VKNKNMILMGVAIGCGLVAAFLVAKLGANGTPKQDMVDVIVAKKDIPIGTLMAEKDFNDLLTSQSLPRAAVPPDVIVDPMLLKGKMAARTLRTGNYFAPADVSTKVGIEVPAGMQSFSIKMDLVRAVTGFVSPGDRVDILAMLPTKKDPNKKASGRILVNMLVTTVDFMNRRPEGGDVATPTIQAVTLAVTPAQAKLLHTAEAGGGDMRLVLRSRDYVPTDGDKPDPVFADQDSNEQINEQKPMNVAPPTPPTPMEEVVYLKKDVAPNTQVTAANLEEYFELKSILAPAPARSVKDLSGLINKYIVIQQSAEFPLMETAVSDKELPKDKEVQVVEKIIEKRVEVPGPAAAVAEQPKPEPKKSLFEHRLNVVGPTGQKTEYFYQGPSKDQMKGVDQPAKTDDQYEVKPLEPNAKPAPEQKPVTNGSQRSL
jgi:pilus assembly protein CpaB